MFFVTQTPKDVPSDVLGQLGSRVQHALRAFTPDDAKAKEHAKSAAQKAEATPKEETKPAPRSRRKEKSVVEQVITSQPVKSFARQAGREIGRQILRSVFGVRSR